VSDEIILPASSRGCHAYRVCQRGCHKDATRKLLPWNLSLRHCGDFDVAWQRYAQFCLLSIKLKIKRRFGIGYTVRTQILTLTVQAILAKAGFWFGVGGAKKK